MRVAQIDGALPLTPEVAWALRGLRFMCANSAIWNAAMAALGEWVPPVTEAEPRIGAALAAGGALLVFPQRPSTKDLAVWRDTLELLVPSPGATGALWGAPVDGAPGPAMLATPERGIVEIEHARLALTPDRRSLAVADVPPPARTGRPAVVLGRLPPIALAAIAACGGSFDELLRRATRRVEADGTGGWRVEVASGGSWSAEPRKATRRR